MDELTSDFDTAWKQALQWFFQPFLEFLFPHVQGAVDWNREPQFLDKELQKIAPEAETGRGTVDALVKVWLLDGTEEWLLIHIEVQSQYDADFPERMYRYNHRLFDLHGRMPVSLAVLGDESGTWRPQVYENARLGCEVRFSYSIAKLIDHKSREQELMADPNPFAAITLAHLRAMETRGDAAARYSGKLSLVKSLYDRGMSRERILRLFRLIDWMLKLPSVMRRKFSEEIDMFEKEKEVMLLSPTEQMWWDDAVAEGNLHGVISLIDLFLKTRFGEEGEKLMPLVRQLRDLDLLNEFFKTAITTPDLATLRTSLPLVS